MDQRSPITSKTVIHNYINGHSHSCNHSHTYLSIVLKTPTYIKHWYGWLICQMIHDMIYDSHTAHDMWHDATCQTSLITLQQTEAGWLHVPVVWIRLCDDIMWWCFCTFGFRPFLRSIDFPTRLLISRGWIWMKQNSVARRLDLEDRFFPVII